MTTAPDTSRRYVAALSAWVLVPTVVVVGGCVLVSSLVAQAPGLRGALLGASLTSGFFLSGQLVLSAVRSIAPHLLMIIALLTYALQVVVLLAVFSAFHSGARWSEHTSTTSLGVTILVCTAAWTVSLVGVARQERVVLYDLDEGVR